jgi:hypothetical protein
MQCNAMQYNVIGGGGGGGCDGGGGVRYVGTGYVRTSIYFFFFSFGRMKMKYQSVSQLDFCEQERKKFLFHSGIHYNILHCTTLHYTTALL